jgi:hypothetical protein
LVSLATETASEPLRMALAKVLRNIGRHANNRTRLYKVRRRRKRGNELCTVMYGAVWCYGVILTDSFSLSLSLSISLFLSLCLSLSLSLSRLSHV